MWWDGALAPGKELGSVRGGATSLTAGALSPRGVLHSVQTECEPIQWVRGGGAISVG
jgi:hypothetical protein